MCCCVSIAVWLCKRVTILRYTYITYLVNILKPTGYRMHQQVEHFNNCTLCPHCICVFCTCLRTNRDLCHLHKKLLVFITEMKCLQRDTDWAFK
jgi:hypothetical protein